MAPLQKCPKCGLELADPTAKFCPMCAANLADATSAQSGLAGTSLTRTTMGGTPGARIWLGALFQFAFVFIFMLVFGFPKIMIAVFGVMILIGAVVLLSIKSMPALASLPPQPQVTNPALFRILTGAVGLCGIVCFGFLLFGCVIFANSWSSWQQYKGASYHRADFQVTRVYYKRHGKGTDVYASGKVEGQREWMNLLPYLQVLPRSQSELEERVPIGTSIAIYLFPDMKGRARVRIYQEVPTAEAYRRAAMNALRWGLGGLAVCGGILFVLLRLRSMCFQKTETAFYATA